MLKLRINYNYIQDNRIAIIINTLHVSRLKMAKK